MAKPKAPPLEEKGDVASGDDEFVEVVSSSVDTSVASVEDLDALYGHLKAFPSDGSVGEKQAFVGELAANPSILSDEAPVETDNVTVEPVAVGPSFEAIVEDAIANPPVPDNGSVSDEIRDANISTPLQVPVLIEGVVATTSNVGQPIYPETSGLDNDPDAVAVEA